VAEILVLVATSASRFLPMALSLLEMVSACEKLDYIRLIKGVPLEIQWLVACRGSKEIIR